MLKISVEYLTIGAQYGVSHDINKNKLYAIERIDCEHWSYKEIR